MEGFEGDGRALVPAVPLAVGFFPWGRNVSGETLVLSWEEVGELLERRQAGTPPCWTPVRYRHWGVCRDDDPVVAVSCLVLDVVDGTPWKRLPVALGAYEFLAHPLPGHTPAAPRYRLVLPLAHPVAMADWGVFFGRAQLVLTGGHASCGGLWPNRPLAVPSDRPEGQHLLRNRGRWLHPAELLIPAVGLGGCLG